MVPATLLGTLPSFLRDIAVQTIGGILAAATVAISAAIWLAAPPIATRYGISMREGAAWVIAVTSTAVSLVLVVLVGLLRRQNQPARISKPGTMTITSDGGKKPSLTIRHQGDPAVYTVDAKIVSLLANQPNPMPTPFRAYLNKFGTEAAQATTLADGQWATMILGTIEVIEHADWSSQPELAIRRGKFGQHTLVPDPGAVVEISIQTDPPTREGNRTMRYRLVRDGLVAVVTEETA